MNGHATGVDGILVWTDKRTASLLQNLATPNKAGPRPACEELMNLLGN